MWQLHISALLIFLAGAAVLLVLFHNSTTVIGGGRQAKSITDNFTGKVRIVMGGWHFFWPWEEILHNDIDLNLEVWAMDNAHKSAIRVTASDGTALLIEVGLKAATGRECYPNGQPLGQHEIDEVAIWRAATLTEPDKESRRKYIQELFGVFDRIFAHYKLEEIMRPHELDVADRPLVPPQKVCFRADNGYHEVELEPIKVSDRSEFFVRIALWAEMQLNYELRDSGFTVHEVRINDAIPEDAEARDAIRQQTVNRLRTKALEALPPGTPPEMGFLVGGDDQALAEAAKAAAFRRLVDKAEGLIDRLAQAFGPRTP